MRAAPDLWCARTARFRRQLTPTPPGIRPQPPLRAFPRSRRPCAVHVRYVLGRIGALGPDLVQDTRSEKIRVASRAGYLHAVNASEWGDVCYYLDTIRGAPLTADTYTAQPYFSRPAHEVSPRPCVRLGAHWRLSFDKGFGAAPSACRSCPAVVPFSVVVHHACLSCPGGTAMRALTPVLVTDGALDPLPPPAALLGGSADRQRQVAGFLHVLCGGDGEAPRGGQLTPVTRTEDPPRRTSPPPPSTPFLPIYCRLSTVCLLLYCRLSTVAGSRRFIVYVARGSKRGGEPTQRGGRSGWGGEDRGPWALVLSGHPPHSYQFMHHPPPLSLAGGGV